MNKIYIIKEMAESDQWDGDYDIPVTTIVQEAELINTIIPADGNLPFYEVVPHFTIDEYNRIKEQKPIFSNRQGISKPINSIYVNEIFSSEILALEASYSKNIDIIENREKNFKRIYDISGTIQTELNYLQEKVKEYHKIEKNLNPRLNEAIDYYTYLLGEKINKLKENNKREEKKEGN